MEPAAIVPLFCADEIPTVLVGDPNNRPGDTSPPFTAPESTTTFPLAMTFPVVAVMFPVNEVMPVPAVTVVFETMAPVPVVTMFAGDVTPPVAVVKPEMPRVPLICALPFTVKHPVTGVQVMVEIPLIFAPPAVTLKPLFDVTGPLDVMAALVIVPAAVMLPAFDMLNLLAPPTCRSTSLEAALEAVSVTFENQWVNVVAALFQLADVLKVGPLVTLPRVMLSAPSLAMLPRTAFVLSRNSARFAVCGLAPVTASCTCVPSEPRIDWLLVNTLVALRRATVVSTANVKDVGVETAVKPLPAVTPEKIPNGLTNAEAWDVPSGNVMTWVLIVPATSKAACGVLVPMPTFPPLPCSTSGR